MTNNLDYELSILLLIFFIFFATNFSPIHLGIIYVLMIFTYLFAKISNKIPDFPFSIGSKKLPILILIVGITTLAWLFISQYAMSIFGFATVGNLGSVVNLLADNTAPPYITNNPYLFELVFGILIPLAETFFFFGLVMPWIMKHLKFTYSDKFKWIVCIVAIGLICSLFHYTAHIFSNEALIADFIFFALSGIVVLYYKDMTAASLLHIVSNSALIMGMLGLIP